VFLFESCVWLRPVCRSNTACFGCSAVRLFDCSAAQLLGRSAESVGWPRDGSTSPEMPVAFRRFCPESGSDSLFGPAFRTCFGIGFRACFAICFGTGFRICFSGLLQDLLRDLLSDLFPGQLSGLASGSAFRMQVLFCLIVECEVWFRSGRRIRLRNFCRSSSRRRACNSLLPVFLDLCRVPMI